MEARQADDSQSSISESRLVTYVRQIPSGHRLILLILCLLLFVVWNIDGIRSSLLFKHLPTNNSQQEAYSYSSPVMTTPYENADATNEYQQSATRSTTGTHGSSETGSVYNRTGISCAAIFKGDKRETRRAEEYMQTTERTVMWTAERYNQSTSNCARFKVERGYITRPESEEEGEFPLAFSILMYTDYEQTERLLRAIYRPQNFYCIHPDARAKKEVHETLRSIVRCFDNVFIAPKLWEVYWGHISMMYAERTCLEKLADYSWYYSINLSGQMFPLRTNGELVEILKLYGGANDIEGHHAEALQFHDRYEHKWQMSRKGEFRMTSEKKAPPPYDVTVYKGTNNAAISRPFALYFLHSNASRELMEYLADTYIPDEFLWPTLNRNPQIAAPGGYFGDLESYSSNTRLTVWSEQPRGLPCYGKFVRTVCNFGVYDLAWLDERPEMFVNKFNRGYHWLAFDCMEERLLNRTLDLANRTQLNLTYYSNLPFVKNKQYVMSSTQNLTL